MNGSDQNPDDSIQDNTIVHGQGEVSGDMSASLVVVRGENPTMRYELEASETIVGRHVHCDFVLRSETVSRRHIKVLRKPEGYFVEDLKSFNGTLINGRRMGTGEQQQLRNKDLIQLSNFQLVFVRPETGLDGLPSIHLNYDKIKEEAEAAIKNFPVSKP